MPAWDTLDPTLKLLLQLGLVGLVIYGVWYVLLTPRKDKEGKERSPLLVVGSSHDKAVAAAQRSTTEIRRFYEELLGSERSQQSNRVAEWRALREEEKARATEADERLKENSVLLRDLANDLKEARLDLARAVALLGNLPPDRRGSPKGDADA